MILYMICMARNHNKKSSFYLYSYKYIAYKFKTKLIAIMKPIVTKLKAKINKQKIYKIINSNKGCLKMLQHNITFKLRIR